MPAQNTDAEPRGERLPFEEWDFAGLAPDRARNPEYNDRRLSARRKVAALGKELVAAGKAEGLDLDTRTSLHNPHAFNANRVDRIWTYVCRGKREKTRLRKVLGRDLAKDLDSAFRNAYLCVAIEHEALEVSLRIHPDGWYDGQNLVRRVGSEGVHGWLELLNGLAGFQLRLHDWKGDWPCGDLTPERLEEFLRFYTPGEHRFAVERRWPVPDAPGGRDAALGDGVPDELVAEAQRLIPLYRFTAWSEESNFLFSD